ncbi:hypothetical protein MBLNU230_g3957t1 [Neophaeotheca triangularis]
MDEASTPKPPPPTSMASNALSEQELTSANGFAAHVHDHPSDYQSHMALIDILHKGFMNHIYPADEGAEPRDPHQYELLPNLRQARQHMEASFSVGEAMSMTWLSDETLLARSAEDFMELLTLFEKVVAEEPASTKIWVSYIDFLQANYEFCQDAEAAQAAGVPEDELEMRQAIFTRETILDVLQRATTATMTRFDNSHLIWNRYFDALMESLPANPSPQEAEQICQDVIFPRLMTPHVDLDSTKQKCLAVIMRLFPDGEGMAAELSERMKPIQRAVSGKQKWEDALRQAAQIGDEATVYNTFVEYIAFQSKKVHPKAPTEEGILHALYERALLRFPTVAHLWVEYTSTLPRDGNLGRVIERATKHCPWSGDLWARRILRAEVDGNSRIEAEINARAQAGAKLSPEEEGHLRAELEARIYNEIVEIKDAATNSVLRDAGGIDEYIKAWVGWVTYLRHHAFKAGSSEDDFDVSYSGIISASEDVYQAGKKLHGDTYRGDPYFRVDRVKVKFLTMARKIAEARQVWQDLTPTHGAYVKFWTEWYQFELLQWGYERMSDEHRVETSENAPKIPTAILEQAMEKALTEPTFDSPEALSALYLQHCQLHESAEKLEVALANTHKFQVKIAARLEREQATVPNEAAPAPMEVDSGKSKRKRGDEDMEDTKDHKKAKETPEAPEAADGEDKRNRETLVLVISNLPVDVEKVAVSKFFMDLGKPKSIAQVKMNDGLTSSAVVEFASQEDVVSAKTRDGKPLFGGTGPYVRISDGSYSSLYVTNYPPRYREDEIRQLFKRFGEIAAVRMPSLKYKDTRRFAYVQFLSHEVAKAAEDAMDGTKIDKDHKLLAKISDPNNKNAQRSGAMSEGREIVVKNLDRNIKEQHVREMFREFGTIERVKQMFNFNGMFLGTCIIAYSKPEEATAALAMNNKLVKQRIISVVIATERGGTDPQLKARIDSHIVRNPNSATPEPSAGTPTAVNGDGEAAADVDMGETTTALGNHSISDPDPSRTARERKVAVFAIPDTVNSQRVQDAMEAHGALLKVQMRRNLRGAIIEFEDLDVATKLKAGVDVPDIGPHTKTGLVENLLAKKGPNAGKSKGAAETGGGGEVANPYAADAPASNTMFRPALRARGRGGLSFGRGGRGGRGARGGLGSTSGRDANAAGDAGAPGSGVKSNADFRNMFVKAKEDGGEKDKDTEMGG